MDRAALRSTSAHVLVDAELLVDNGAISLDDDTEHHLRKVLRLRDGEPVGVTDGQGRWCLAVSVGHGNTLRLEATSAVDRSRLQRRSRKAIVSTGWSRR
jgi:16S rRNA U1498 N3-methylase RsmE